jgi:hypothetical protein
MPGLGHRGYLRLATETAFANNTPSALGVEYMPVTAEGFKSVPSYIWPEGIRAETVTRRKVQGAIKASGNISWEVDVEDGIGIILKNTLPLEEFTNLGAGNGGSHVFKVGDLQLPPSMCFRICRDLVADPTNIWDYVGARVKKLGFNAAEGAILKATADFSAQKGTAGAANVTPSYTTQNPLVYYQGSITVQGQSVNVKSFKLDIDTGLIEGRGMLGSQYDQQAQKGMYKVTGELDTYFDSMTQVNDFLNATDVDITLNFLGTALGSSTRQLQFELPTAQFTGEPPVIANPKEIMLKLPFTAYRSGTGGLNNIDELIVITLLNSIQTTY